MWFILLNNLTTFDALLSNICILGIKQACSKSTPERDSKSLEVMMLIA